MTMKDFVAAAKGIEKIQAAMKAGSVVTVLEAVDEVLNPPAPPAPGDVQHAREGEATRSPTRR